MIDAMFQSEIDQTLDDRVARPLPERAPSRGFWSAAGGVAAAPFKGAGVGLGLEVPASMADLGGTFGALNLASEVPQGVSMLADLTSGDVPDQARRDAQSRILSGEAFSTELGTGLRVKARSFAPDPATSNMAEQLLFGLGRFGGKAVGYSLLMGPAGGALMMGVDEGMTEADRLKAEGVDIQTRTKVGVATGISSAVAVRLPVSGRTTRQTIGYVAAGGPGGFIAQQAASKSILENAGYNKIADQYDPFDPVGLAVSTLVPVGFGAYALRGVRARQQAQAGRGPGDPAAERELAAMGANERQALRYNDPRLDAYAVTAAQREGIPPEALLAIKNAGEKSPSSAATSPVGAKGIMQFMDETWAAYGRGTDVRDPLANIDASARFMKDLIAQYDGNVRAAIAHYNGGGRAGRAVQRGEAPPAGETQRYLRRTDEYIAARQGEEAGRAAASDPEAVAAARVHLARQAMDSTNLYAAQDIVGASRHVDAVMRASDQLAAGERVDVSSMIDVERINIGRAYDLVRALPEGDRFDPMVMIRPEDIDAVAISRGGWRGIGDIEVKGQGYGLVKFIWRHGEESSKAPELQIGREDLMAFPSVIRNFEPTRQAAPDGSRGREWRVSLPGPDGKARTVVFAENKVEGSDVRQVVSAYVQDPGKPGHDAPISKEKTNLGPESPGKWMDTHAGDTLDGFLHQPGRDKLVDASIAKRGEIGISDVLDAQTAEISRLSPDMMVQLEGMDQPMRLADALEAVKAEADAEVKDAPLLKVAAECFLRNG
ncbi:MAG TPA: lytic transglycosylase domain-containing protein [Burkholderiaceae bacterium]|nr:lytic transglycosylase domain-containing protein [Burkholderiaceae bacterium]